MNHTKGFALLQALFFMMFILAVVSVSMMMSAQRNTNSSGERLALDAYPAANMLLTAFIKGESEGQGATYFSAHPLSPDYVTQLTAEGFSNPTNITITLAE